MRLPGGFSVCAVEHAWRPSPSPWPPSSPTLRERKGERTGGGGLRAGVRIPRARTYTDLPRCGRGLGKVGLRAGVRIPRARTYTDLPRCGRGRGEGGCALGFGYHVPAPTQTCHAAGEDGGREG